MMISTEKAISSLPLIARIYKKLDKVEFAKEMEKSKKEFDTEDTEIRQLIGGLDMFAYILENADKIKNELIELIAIIENKEFKEVKEQDFTVTLISLKNIFENKELMFFFKSAMK